MTCRLQSNRKAGKHAGFIAKVGRAKTWAPLLTPGLQEEPLSQPQDLVGTLRAERDALRARVAELEARTSHEDELRAHLQVAADLIDCLTDGQSPAETAADYRRWLGIKRSLGLA